MTPTLQGYIAFLTNVVKINMTNLPPFAGLGTLEAGSSILAITTVTTGALADWAIVTDANGSIPVNTVIRCPLDPDPPIGVGTYVMSQDALSTQSTPEAISATNQWIVQTFGVALETVNEALRVSQKRYIEAVYNLATDRLINWAPDIADQTYWEDMRRRMSLARPALGIPSSASDQGSAGSLLNPEFMRSLTASDLQIMRTPYGRTYIGIAQDFGPGLYGVT